MQTNPLGPELMRVEVQEFHRLADPLRLQATVADRFQAVLRRHRRRSR